MPWRVGPGQQAAFRLLETALARGQVAHAYLFTGPGPGLAQAGLELARALNCLEGPGEPCGVCLHCRRSARGNLADVGVVEPDQGTMKLAQVRNVQRALGMVSHESRYKVWILDRADTMSAEASNSLLKLLEDPPGDAVLVLTATSPSSLPATVLSRCQVVRFSPPSPQELVEDLCRQGLPPDEAAIASRLWGTDTPGIVETSRSIGLVGLAERVVQDLSSLGDPLELGASWEGVGKGLLGVYLDLAILALRDAYLLAWGLEGAGQTTGASSLSAWGPGRLEQCLGIALRTRGYVEGNVNTRLALDVMFLDLEEVVRGCQ
ncbi:MAG TPA: hypothetical protein DCM14_01680 [Clostridiales bacterium UBA8153]|nr:hypothetical protein [Clostridiales bacterium UBA8153]